MGTYLGEDLLTKIETTESNNLLRVHRLQIAAQSDIIFEALGNGREITLDELWCILTLQPKGEIGPLLNNGKSNIFFIRDEEKSPWIVDAAWDHADWKIRASQLGGTFIWARGSQIISR